MVWVCCVVDEVLNFSINRRRLSSIEDMVCTCVNAEVGEDINDVVGVGLVGEVSIGTEVVCGFVVVDLEVCG